MDNALTVKSYRQTVYKAVRNAFVRTAAVDFVYEIPKPRRDRSIFIQITCLLVAAAAAQFLRHFFFTSLSS